MNASKPVTEADLNAYVDGFLDADERLRVEKFLADNPDTAAMVADWQADSEAVLAAFSGHAISRDGDKALVSRPNRKTPRQRMYLPAIAAASLMIFAAGIATGHYGSRIWGTPNIELVASEILPQEAKNAYLVYASEVRHPVEVFAEEETHLANWLGKRLAIDKLQVPDLKPLGFKLIGGRLLPVDGRPGALFMYEDETGQRITVLVGRNAENRDTSFRFASADKLETFYWIDGDLGYAVTGEIPRDLLRRIAEECYRQFPS